MVIAVGAFRHLEPPWSYDLVVDRRRPGHRNLLLPQRDHHRSPYLALRTTELADNVGHRLQALTPLDTELIGRYDVPPYVNSVDQSGSVPFLDIDNRYILAGAQYDPQVLAGLSISQIASRLRDPGSPVAKAIDGSADVLIAAISQLLKPAARS